MATNIKLKRSATSGAAPSTSDLDLGEIALNTYDGKMYMKKTVSGTSTIVELSGSQAATSSAFAHDDYKYTADANQTTFTGSDANSETLAYTAGQIQVYLNGILLDVTDYTATNGTSVVLASAASANDILYIVSFKGSNPFSYFKYTASNAQTSFSGNDANSESLIYTVGNLAVYLNGVLLDATDYTATNGTAVVLASGASSGDILVIIEYNETGLTQVGNDDSPQLGGDLDVVTHDIVSTSNRDIDIIPHGTGNVNLGTDTIKVGTSGENITVTTNGTGDMTLSTNSGTNSGTIVIADGANQDITLTPNGTGDVIIDGLKYPQADGSADQVLKTDGSGQLAFTTISSNSIVDADGDTKIQVEESSDEDTIRFDIAGTEQIVLADGVLKPTTDNDIDLGTSSLEFKNAFFDGTVTTDALVADTADINGGTVDGATVGANSASSGAFTTIAASSTTDLNGTLNVSGTLSLDGSANELRFYEGSNYVGFEAPALSADQIWVLPTADGSSGQMLKTDGSGTLSWATASSTVTGLTDTTISSIASGDYLIYNGSAWVNQAQASNAVISTMTGDNSDTTLSLSRAPLTENAVNVYWDGVYQHKDNWSLSGTTLTFSTAPGTGVKVEAVVGSQTNILYGNDVAIDTMTGDNSDTTLALSVTPSNENHVNVYFDGVYQSKSNFSLSGSTITFSTAPPTGVVVEAVSNQAVSVGTATGIAASALTGLSEVTAAAADHVLVYDASGSALKKVTVQSLADVTDTSLLATDIKIGEDDQTKIDFETADEIHFYAANAEQVYIADGVFGPQTDADVDLGTSGVEFKDLYLDGTAHIDTLDVDVNATIAGTLGVDSRVGIGVAAHSSAALNITSTDQNIRLNNGSELGIIDLDSDGKLDLWAHGDGETINFRTGTGDGTVAMAVVGTTVMIGASDLGGALNITHGNEFGLVTSGGYNYQAKFESTDAEAAIVIEDSNSGTDYNRIGVITNDMTFITNNSERMRIHATGRTAWSANGMGSTGTVPRDFAFYTEGSTNGVEVRSNDERLLFLGAAGSSGTGSDTGYLAINDQGTTKIALNANGESAIAGGTFYVSGEGTSFAAGSHNGMQFAINGQSVSSRAADNLQTHKSFYNTNGSVGTIKTTGSTTQFNTSSDYRLKENVVTDWDGTTLLKQLKPSKFNFKADTDTTIQGFLAHEVSSIVPQAVSGEKDAVYTAEEAADGEGVEGQPNYQGIDHSHLVPLLVKTIQELEARITTLEE